MKVFFAGSFVTFARQLGVTESTLSEEQAPFGEERLETFRQMLHEAGKELHRAGFGMSSHIISDVLRWTRERQIEPSFADVSKWSFQIFKTIQHEMHDVICIRLDAEQERLLSEDFLFGEKVADRFNSVRDDVVEAGKCLAYERGTACVFHLMRVVEAAIKAIWKTLSLNPPNLPNSWGNLLDPMDKQLALSKKQRHDLWAKEEAFFAEAVSDLRAIKKAWRDTTTHLEKNYNLEQARKVFNAVEGFMRDLAGRLDQDGKFYPVAIN